MCLTYDQWLNNPADYEEFSDGPLLPRPYTDTEENKDMDHYYEKKEQKEEESKKWFSKF